MDIFLVRHGEAAVSWGQATDPGLSDLGREEAEMAARYLVENIADNSVLMSSPLSRAQETAEPLATLLGKTVQLDDVFREIPSPVPMAERQGWLRQFMQQQWHQQPEDLTTWRDGIVQRLLELQQPTVVFTHFLVINAVVGQQLGREETLCFWPANGSITRLRNTGTGLELLALGDEIESVVN
jgi:broad specificity phosphatase PhoE